MKNLINTVALAVAITFAGTATAQNAHEASVKINKNNQNAVVADYDAPSSVVEGALKERLAKEGLGKMKTSKGFMTYSGVLWNSVSKEKMDVYFKVEGKKEKSTISVLVSRGYDNFISSGNDAPTIENVKSFLNSFMNDTKAYQLGLNIAAQEEMVKKAEKAFSNSTSNNKDLLSEKEKIEKKIAESTNDITLKQRALDEEKQKLQELKAMAK